MNKAKFIIFEKVFVKNVDCMGVPLVGMVTGCRSRYDQLTDTTSYSYTVIFNHKVGSEGPFLEESLSAAPASATIVDDTIQKMSYGFGVDDTIQKKKLHDCCPKCQDRGEWRGCALVCRNGHGIFAG